MLWINLIDFRNSWSIEVSILELLIICRYRGFWFTIETTYIQPLLWYFRSLGFFDYKTKTLSIHIQLHTRADDISDGKIDWFSLIWEKLIGNWTNYCGRSVHCWVSSLRTLFLEHSVLNSGIMAMSGTYWSSEVSSIFMAVAQMIATFVAYIFIDRKGWKFLMVVSTLGCTLGHLWLPIHYIHIITVLILRCFIGRQSFASVSMYSSLQSVSVNWRLLAWLNYFHRKLDRLASLSERWSRTYF